MDDEAFIAAVEAHKHGQTMFTRRMVIAIALMSDQSPEGVVHRAERLQLLKPGAWQWFADNGGITKEHVDQVVSDLGKELAA